MSGFEKFYNYIITNRVYEKLSVKDLFELIYNQGKQEGPDVKEISQEEVGKFVEDQCFINFIKDCIEEKIPENKMNYSDYAIVTYPCTSEDKEKCIAWPDRCQECGGDGETCGTKIINLTKLCNVKTGDIFIKPNIETLTKDEAAKLSEELANFIENTVSSLSSKVNDC